MNIFKPKYRFINHIPLLWLWNKMGKKWMQIISYWWQRPKLNWDRKREQIWHQHKWVYGQYLSPWSMKQLSNNQTNLNRDLFWPVVWCGSLDMVRGLASIISVSVSSTVVPTDTSAPSCLEICRLFFKAALAFPRDPHPYAVTLIFRHLSCSVKDKYLVSYQGKNKEKVTKKRTFAHIHFTKEAIPWGQH